MPASTTINIAIADDHPAVAFGIKAILTNSPSLRVTGIASNSTEIVKLISQHPCDLLITDFAMPDDEYDDGFDMLSFLRTYHPDLPIVVFTGLDGAAFTNKLLKLGINAIVHKADAMGHLVTAVYAAIAKAEYLSPGVARATSDWSKKREHPSLTKCEIEVLRRYVSGLSINEIAAQLHRTKQTISTQKIKGMQKLGVERDADLYKLVYDSRCGLSDILS